MDIECSPSVVWTNARHGSAAEGRVIRPAILWNDQRTGKAVDAIEATVSRQELIQRKSLSTGFQLPKLVWLRTEEPQAYAQVQQFFCQRLSRICAD